MAVNDTFPKDHGDLIHTCIITTYFMPSRTHCSRDHFTIRLPASPPLYLNKPQPIHCLRQVPVSLIIDVDGLHFR